MLAVVPILLYTALSANIDYYTQLQQATEKIRKSVVFIHARKAGTQDEWIPTATGFFVSPEGLIATAAHVHQPVDGQQIELAVLYKDYRFLPVKVIIPEYTVTFNADNPQKTSVWPLDICLLQCVEMPSTPITSADLSDRTEFKIGEPIAVYGFYETGICFSIKE